MHDFGGGLPCVAHMPYENYDLEKLVGGFMCDLSKVADLVLLETDALGPDSALCAIGSLQAAAVANAAGIPVWLVAGIGRCLPQRMWEPLRDMVISDEPWEDLFEVVPTELMTSVIGPGGPIPAAEARFRTDCPVAPELFR